MTLTTLPNYEEIEDRELGSFFSSTLKENFTGLRYEAHPPLPLVEDSDKSVLFTGSTSNTFKKYISGDVPLNRCYFTEQPCLRVRNAPLFLDDGTDMKWGSMFNMFGTVGPAQSFPQQSADIWHYFREKLAVPQKRLALQAHPVDQDLIQAWQAFADVELEIGMQPEKYYRWKYGETGVTGRGVTLALKAMNGQDLMELGNIIEISHEGRPFAIEMGFGIECMISRFKEYEHTIEATIIADLMPLNSQLLQKMADAIHTSMVILDLGIQPSARGQGRVLKNYLQGASYLYHKTGFSRDRLASLLLGLEKRIKGTNQGLAYQVFNYIFDIAEETRISNETVSEVQTTLIV
jgi:alanyl-tRNA synthetase